MLEYGESRLTCYFLRVIYLSNGASAHKVKLDFYFSSKLYKRLETATNKVKSGPKVSSRPKSDKL